jgi:hypothetical protein
LPAMATVTTRVGQDVQVTFDSDENRSENGRSCEGH